MIILKIATALSLSILLAACIETEEDDTTTINEFTTTNSAGLSRSTIDIDPAIDDGAFSLQWDIDSSNPYHIDLYLSEDSQLSKSTDIKFFGQNCGTPSSIYNCGTTADFDCRFTSENKISCGEITQANKETNVSPFLDSLPKDAFIIIEACNGLRDSCETSSTKVVFR